MAAELLPSAVPCWSIPPSQCINSARLCRTPIQGIQARRLCRRNVPLAVSQLAAAAADSPPGYLSRARKPRGTAMLNPAEDAVSLQQLLLVQQQQLLQQQALQQQQHAELSFNGADSSADSLQEHLQDEYDALQHPLLLSTAPDHDQRSIQHQHQQHWPAQNVSNAVPVPQVQHHHWQQQQQEQRGQKQPQQHVARQQRAMLQERRMQQKAVQQQHAAQKQRLSQQQQQQQQHEQWLLQQSQLSAHQQQQQWQQQQLPQPQQNGHGQHVHQQQQAAAGYFRGPIRVQQQQGQRSQQQQQQPQQQQQQQQQGHAAASSGVSSASSNSDQSASSSSRPGGASAYSVVPTSTAPSIAHASAAAAAAAAAAATAARSRSKCSSSTSAQAAAAAAAAPVVLPPAVECVPRAFWGLMSEELRPWHREVLVHLCYVLPAPACHIYRDMKPSRMQQVLAQRAMLEKELRGHLVELVYQQQLIQGWLKTLQARQPRVDKSLNPDSVLQSQQQLLNLKAALGRTRFTLHTLQDRAAAYSDRDYVQYTQVFAEFLSEVEDLAELQHHYGAPCVLQLQKLQEAAARRVLFARSEDAVSALHREAGARAKALLQSERPVLDRTKQRVEQLRARMQGFGWRYPPTQFVAWRFKGASKGVRSPWGRTPGVQRREPQARLMGEQQQQQQPGAPPPLLGS